MANHSKISLSVFVDKQELVKTLHANRSKHVDDYTSAYSRWRTETSDELQSMLESFKSGDSDNTGIKYLPRPTSHAPDYDTAIGLLSLTEQETIELNADDYRRFVQDEWDWKQDFIGTNSYYGVSSE